MSDNTQTRYAIYYAPEAESLLWQFGSSLIGYDAAVNKKVLPCVPAGYDPDQWMQLTAEPRRYGFHATLKAPFYLKNQHSEPALIKALQDFSQSHFRIELDGLKIRSIGCFIAMTPLAETTQLNVLAAEVVSAFDEFRAPMTATERERRMKSPLTERQIVNLDRWGYPYVFDDFRFHMTLTGPIHSDDRIALRDHLRDMAERAGLNGPISIDRLALFKQDNTQSQFRIIATSGLR